MQPLSPDETLAAAAAGATAASLANQSNDKLARRACDWGSGFIAAVVLGPAVGDYFTVVNAHYYAAIICITGVGGHVIVKAFLDQLNDGALKQALDRLFARVFGKNDPKP